MVNYVLTVNIIVERQKVYQCNHQVLLMIILIKLVVVDDVKVVPVPVDDNVLFYHPVESTFPSVKYCTVIIII